MEIRVLKQEDAAPYWELRLRALKEDPDAFATTYEEAMQIPNPLERQAQRLVETENAFTLGAWDEQGQLVGVVTFIRDQPARMAHKGNIFAMYVAPETRGKRVGQQLVDAVIAKAKTLKGIERINLTVNAANEPARRLYLRAGFTVYGFEKNGMKVGDRYIDEEWMALSLI
ncbi:MAG TPA: GNAT family N-acetyltransferase [Bacilli bacterium]|nr:GNAT family N-acetyltransferase [Bacilli bacterium]